MNLNTGNTQFEGGGGGGGEGANNLELGIFCARGSGWGNFEADQLDENGGSWGWGRGGGENCKLIWKFYKKYIYHPVVNCLYKASGV